MVSQGLVLLLFLAQLVAAGHCARAHASPAVAYGSVCKAPLIVFGASMVDVGENAEAMPLRSSAEFPPYGLDYFHHPAARYSNGRLIIDFISQGLGYGLLDPFLKSIDPNFAHGVSFASSGSTARNTTVTGNGTDSSGLFSLDVQVDQYSRFKARVLQAQSKSKGSLKNLPTATGFSRAIHFIETALNDYITAFLRTPNFDPLSLVLSVISAMEAAIRRLHREGARNVIVMNVIPLGCTPGFLATSTSSNEKLDKDACMASINSVVDLHNIHLQQLINNLRVELSLKGLVVFDANAIYLDAIRHPSNYGVTHPFQACCGAGGGKYNILLSILCGKSGVVNGTLFQANRCKNPSQYISWDGLHPVETFARHIGDGVLSGQYLKPNLSLEDICKAY